MASSNTIYIYAKKENQQFLTVPIESVIILQIYGLCNSKTNLKVLLNQDIKKAYYNVNVSKINYEKIIKAPKIATYCLWPVLVTNRTLIGGICAVSRAMIKHCDNLRYLLGFRECCLTSCSENSTWTKFCEIDMPNCINDFIENTREEMPYSVARFEYHMGQPVQTHNIGKVKQNLRNDKSLEHLFVEGTYVTLCDVLLFPCFKIFFDVVGYSMICNVLNLTSKWIERVRNCVNFELEIKFDKEFKCITSLYNNKVVSDSLYKTNVNKTKFKTDQSKIEKFLQAVSNSSIKIINDSVGYANDIQFDWNKIPMELNPTGGSVPSSRAERKSQQLESLLKPIIKIASKQNLVVVDFCSGSGHLGLLIAYVLPFCQIILVENKEKSLSRAETQAEKLNLKNVTLVQSNLDYFISNFDIGVSLHACGTATDLVLQKCINSNAHFISCPCCYGGIKNCHILEYPRSKIYKELDISYADYISLAHAADQTHLEDNDKTKQGYVCMDVIDWDRKLHAESLGYEVFLNKLSPVTCTFKNNLLIGIFK